ncbi:SMI1/KNR4 family protein [Psychroserpens luteus]|jgi:hypothetical protein|uniref:SMI1/KNR4 family protein n=1 Tax=Psychroserpens luteus TaxID=1434066 RepID=A0ABW5ZVU0_9FLAO|nr:SMI1/KNR4 family protein [Psychroserpens luteus]
MTTFKNTETRLIIQDILDFENTFDLKLPESYKLHILRFNGGFPEEDLYFKNHPIDSFRPIKYGKRTVEHTIESLKGFLPEKVLPFGFSTSGYFYISLNEKNHGKVYIIFSDGEPELLSSSFNTFMDGLSEEEY